MMAKFGYSIENALVTKIVPADAVVKAMNDINAARAGKKWRRKREPRQTRLR